MTRRRGSASPSTQFRLPTAARPARGASFVHPTRSNEVSRSKLKEMPDLLYRRRNAIALAGIAVLLVGLGVAIGIDAGAGLAVVGLAALLLASVQPQLLAHLRSRQARRGAPRNGHVPGADAHDIDLPSP